MTDLTLPEKLLFGQLEGRAVDPLVMVAKVDMNV